MKKQEYPQCANCEVPLVEDNTYVMRGRRDSYCKTCRKAINRKYNVANADRLRSYHKKYHKQWSVNNRERRNAYQCAYQRQVRARKKQSPSNPES